MTLWPLTSWSEIWIVLSMGMDQDNHKLGSLLPLQLHTFTTLAQCRMMTGWDHFISFLAKQSSCTGICPLALAPLASCFLTAAFWHARRGQTEMSATCKSSIHIVNHSDSQLLKGIYICEEMSKPENHTLFMFTSCLKALLTTYTRLGNTMNGEIKFSTTWLHLFIDSIIYSRNSY